MTEELQFKIFLLKDPENKPIWSAKIRELKEELIKASGFMDALCRAKTAEGNGDTEWTYDWNIDYMRKFIEKLKKQIQMFEFYKRYAKEDTGFFESVGRVKTVPISSFLIGEWQSHGSGRSVICCPLHKEKTASFTWFKQGNTYHCFGCGAGGDNIDLFMKIFNCKFTEAVKELSKII